jgi:pre-mRNA-processing factor 19
VPGRAMGMLCRLIVRVSQKSLRLRLMPLKRSTAGSPLTYPNLILTFYRLSKSRRKRPIPQGWADSEAIGKFNITTASKPLYPGASSLAVDGAGQLAITGGSDGDVGVYSIADNKVQQTFMAGAAITGAVWYGSLPVVSTSSGAVKVFGNGEMTFTSHAGGANGLALHPSGDILASVGVDKSFAFYDLQAKKAVTHIYTDSGMFIIFS